MNIGRYRFCLLPVRSTCVSSVHRVAADLGLLHRAIFYPPKSILLQHFSTGYRNKVLMLLEWETQGRKQSLPLYFLLAVAITEYPRRRSGHFVEMTFLGFAEHDPNSEVRD